MEQFSVRKEKIGSGVPVKIFWDLEGIFDLNKDQEIVDISNSILCKSKKFGRIVSFYGYGDMKNFIFPKQQIKLQTAGVTLVDTPKCHNKSYCNKKILLDLCKFVNGLRFLPPNQQKNALESKEIDATIENTYKGVIVLVTKSPSAYLFSFLRLSALNFKVVIFCEKSKEAEQEIISIDKQNIEFFDWKDINLFSFSNRADKLQATMSRRLQQLFTDILLSFVTPMKNKDSENQSSVSLTTSDLHSFLEKSKDLENIQIFMKYLRNYILAHRLNEQFDTIYREVNEKGFNYTKVELVKAKTENSTAKEKVVYSKMSNLEKQTVQLLSDRLTEKDQGIEVANRFLSVPLEDFDSLPKVEEIDELFLLLFIQEIFSSGEKFVELENKIELSLQENQDFSEKTVLFVKILPQNNKTS